MIVLLNVGKTLKHILKLKTLSRCTISVLSILLVILLYSRGKSFVGRSLNNAMLNLNVKSKCAKALKHLGVNLEDLFEQEMDAGLGNGGLGRLAACFLDSLATMARFFCLV